jgi:hypothetical protein
MAEVLDLAELAVSDRAELEEVDFDRDTALTFSSDIACAVSRRGPPLSMQALLPPAGV